VQLRRAMAVVLGPNGSFPGRQSNAAKRTRRNGGREGNSKGKGCGNDGGNTDKGAALGGDLPKNATTVERGGRKKTGGHEGDVLFQPMRSWKGEKCQPLKIRESRRDRQGPVKERPLEAVLFSVKARWGARRDPFAAKKRSARNSLSRVGGR